MKTLSSGYYGRSSGRRIGHHAAHDASLLYGTPRWGAAGPLPEPETGHGGRPRPRRRPIMTDIQKQVQQAIDRLVQSGAERGLQVAVYRNGELGGDAVAGGCDPEN